MSNRDRNHMNDIIVAGIINRNTGEITDTTTNKKDKTSIMLKVRDELGCKHGRGEFMAFEFGGMSHMSYYRKQMKNKCPDVFRGLQILSTKHLIAESKRYVERSKLELAIAESVANDCAKLYQSEENKSKLIFISELTESGIQEAAETLNDAVSELNTRLRYLTKLEEAQFSYEKECQRALTS